MYQSVEEDGVEAPGEDAAAKSSNRTKIALAIVAGLLLLALAALLSATGPQHDSGSGLDKLTEREDYLSAISAPTPALRRARLTDLLATHTKHPQTLAARAQLQVLNEKEAADWAEATNIFYDPEADIVQKTIALDQYEQVWGSNLTGGREAELTDMQAALTIEVPEITINSEDENAAEKPDFTPTGKDIFPNTVPDDTMAGGNVAFPRGTYIPPRPVERRPAVRRSGNVEEARVRRNVTPRYPSKALRRNIEAEVTLSLYIDDDGDVEMTELVSVSAPRYQRDFIRAAERAALRTRYHPKRINGRAVPSSGVLKRYVFQLGD